MLVAILDFNVATRFPKWPFLCLDAATDQNGSQQIDYFSKFSSSNCFNICRYVGQLRRWTEGISSSPLHSTTGANYKVSLCSCSEVVILSQNLNDLTAEFSAKQIWTNTSKKSKSLKSHPYIMS